jgi:hypothetical protein
MIIIIIIIIIVIIIIIIIITVGICLRGFQHGTIARAGLHVPQKSFRNMTRNAY